MAIVLLALAVYSPLRRAEYVQDDHLAIESNAVVERGDPIEIFSRSYWYGAQGDDRSLYRPVTVSSFALERRLAGKASPPVSHAVNVLLHVLTSLAVLALARRLGAGAPAAAAAGLLFALHPGHSEAVASVVGRSEILAALFVLAALLAQSGSGRWDPAGFGGDDPPPARARAAAWTAGLCLFLALGSKETAIVGVGLLVLLEVLFRPPAAGAVRPWLVDRAAALAPSALAVVLFVILRTRALEALFTLQSVPVADNVLVRLSGVPRLATALAIAARWGRLLFLGNPLSADYSGDVIASETSLLAPGALLGLLFLLAWTVLALLPLAARRLGPWSRSRPAPPAIMKQVSFSAWTFLLPYLVTGNLLFLVGAGLAERFLYLPSIGVCLLLGTVMGRLVEGEMALLPGSLDSRRRLVGLALIFLMGGFAILTWHRSSVWQDDRSVFDAAVRVYPTSPRANYILATLDDREGKPAEALRRIDTVLALWPGYLAAWLQKAAILGTKGDFRGAEAACRQALRLDPGLGLAYFNLGVALHRVGRLDEAERSLRKAVLWAPGLDQAWAELGHVRLDARRYAEAADAYSRAIAMGRSYLVPKLREARRLAGLPVSASPEPTAGARRPG